jgi:hypothetical protein
MTARRFPARLEFGSVPEKLQKENANYDSDDGESY